MNPFRIGVTGDRAWDVCSVDLPSESPAPRRANRGLETVEFRVPAGAEFQYFALKALFSDGGINIGRVSVERWIASKRSSPPRGAPVGDATVDAWRLQLRRFGPENASTYRIAKKIAIDSSESSRSGAEPTDQTTEEKPGDFDLLLLRESGGRWANGTNGRTTSKNAAKAYLDEFFASRTGSPAGGIRVIVIVDRELPRLKDDSTEFESPVWQVLQKNSKHVCVLCSGPFLRSADAAISRRLSWELTAEDLLSELDHYPPLRALAQFRHFLVRFGLVAVAHVEAVDGEASEKRSMEAERGKVEARLYFAPLVRDGVYRDVERDGETVGNNVLLAASIAAHIAEQRGKSPTSTNPAFEDAIRSAMQASLHHFDTGYLEDDVRDAAKNGGASLVTRSVERLAPFVRNPSKFQARQIQLLEQRGSRKSNELVPERHHAVGWVRIPDHLLQPQLHDPVARPDRTRVESVDTWQILRQMLDGKQDDGSAFPPDRPSQDSLRRRVNIATAIVMYGHDQVLNRALIGDGIVARRVREILGRPEHRAHQGDVSDCITLPQGVLPSLASTRSHLPSDTTPGRPATDFAPIWVPEMTVGSYVVVERTEIESIRSVRNLIETYTRDVDTPSGVARPISIAVFGPPGSGKSFAVKQVIQSINHGLKRKLKTLEFNVAQFRSTADLERASQEISNENNDGAMPVAFFDEFDSSFQGKQLGWLKFFLGMMQDGTLRGAGGPIRLGPAVFVFAGGVFDSYQSFDPGSPPAIGAGPTVSTSSTRHAIRFASRKGPDFISRLVGHVNVLSIDRPPWEYKLVIRRALLLRTFLDQGGYVPKRDSLKRANVDEDVVHSLLTIDRYRHGVRSMEAIIRMCRPIADGPERRLEKCSLPARDQLQMHVDADEFVIRMHRGRIRRTLGQPPVRSTTPPGEKAPTVTEIKDETTEAGGKTMYEQSVTAKPARSPREDATTKKTDPGGTIR